LWGGNSPADEIPGVREKSIKVAGTPIDVTSDESNGWRALLDAADYGEKTVDITISGVTKNDRLKRDWFNQIGTQQLTLEYPDGSVLAGTFLLVDYSETEPYKDAATFSATLQSAGAVTYTPGT
jgi:predicted secreted protein